MSCAVLLLLQNGRMVQIKYYSYWNSICLLSLSALRSKSIPNVLQNCILSRDIWIPENARGQNVLLKIYAFGARSWKRMAGFFNRTAVKTMRNTYKLHLKACENKLRRVSIHKEAWVFAICHMTCHQKIFNKVYLLIPYWISFFSAWMSIHSLFCMNAYSTKVSDSSCLERIFMHLMKTVLFVNSFYALSLSYQICYNIHVIMRSYCTVTTDVTNL